MRPLSRDELFFCKHTGEYSKSQQAAGAGLTPAIRLQPDPDRDKVRSLKLMRCVLVYGCCVLDAVLFFLTGIEGCLLAGIKSCFGVFVL